jgi:hypothetical protein
MPEPEHGDDGLAQTLLRHPGLAENSFLQTAVTRESSEYTKYIPNHAIE